MRNQKLFGDQCDLCGNLTQYADDASYHIANKHRGQNQEKLSQNITRLADFLSSNQLTINKEKTHLVEIMIRQKRGRLPADPPPELQVLNNRNEIETVRNSDHCRILGLNLQHNLTWNSHLEDGVKSLLPSLRRSLGALRTLGN